MNENEDDEIETEDIVITEIKEIIIDEKDQKEWDDFNNKWRNKIKEKENGLRRSSEV